MRRQIFCAASCALAVVLCHVGAPRVNGAVTIEMDFSNTSGSSLTFNGHNGTFTFTPGGSGFDFQINNVTGGTGSALNLLGSISGTYTIGPIVNNAATVTGSGILKIFDGSQNLTADIGLVAIDKPGTGGMINPDEVVNVTDIHYAGTNSDLQTFANGIDDTALLGFFSLQTLAALQSGGNTVTTGFSGSLISTVPEPATMSLFLGGFSMIAGLRVAHGRRKRARK